MKFCFHVFLALLILSTPVYAVSVKQPNVAGTFYSSNPEALSSQIDQYLKEASIEPLEQNIQAMIVPHAGYEYSGPVAAYAYKAASKGQYTTIVILAPSHFFPFKGISVWKEGLFRTPLGDVNLDVAFNQKLLDYDPEFRFLPEVFEKEHSLEVQLPFIQKVFPGAKIVPILMGEADPAVCQKLAKALQELIGGRQDVLVVASSDMSHYLPYAENNAKDAVTLKTVEAMDAQALWQGHVEGRMEMCGLSPGTTMLLYTKARGLQGQVLKHANSGDTAGDRSKVVGYASVAFYSAPAPAPLSDEARKKLVTIAKRVLANFVQTGHIPEIKMDLRGVMEQQGAFVTLRKDGQLRGCIGHIIGDKPLWETVRDMTVAAASQDPRFSPVTQAELKDIDIEISVLSVPQRVKNASEILLGRDGVIVVERHQQGVFLPQVATETKWGKEQFLSELCSQKAGLPADCWKDPKVSLYTFQADVIANP